MKSISSALTTHLGLSTTTLATLWKINRADGKVLGFTDHDQQINYDDGAQLWLDDIDAIVQGTGSSMDSGPFNPTTSYEIAFYLNAAQPGTCTTASAGWAALDGMNTYGGVWFKWLASRAQDEIVVNDTSSGAFASKLVTLQMGTQFAPRCNWHQQNNAGPGDLANSVYTSVIASHIKKGNRILVVLQSAGQGGVAGIGVGCDFGGTYTKIADVSSGTGAQVVAWLSDPFSSTPFFSVTWTVTIPNGVTMYNSQINVFILDGSSVTQYLPAQGFTPSAIEGNSNLSTDNLEVTSFLEVGAISDTDLRAGVYDACKIEIRLVNYNDLTMGDLKLRTGTVGNVVVKNGIGQFEIRGLIYRTQIAIGKLFGPTCRAELGDSDCGIDLRQWNQNGSVLTATDHRQFNPNSGLVMRGSATPFSPAITGWFSAGIITWTSGANLGFSMEVSSWNGTTLLLFESMPFAIAPGDTFVISPGCNLLSGAGGDCFNKFNNIINFRGEPFIPGMDQLVIYPNADGSVPG